MSARALSNLASPALELVDGLAEQRGAAVAAGDEPGRALRHAQGARRTESLGETELLFCKTLCRVVVAERELGERSLRPPREKTRGAHERARQESADGEKVLESLRGSPLGEAQPPAREAKDRGDQRIALRLRIDRRERLLGRFELALVDERLDEQRRRSGRGTSAARVAPSQPGPSAHRSRPRHSSPRLSATQPRLARLIASRLLSPVARACAIESSRNGPSCA